jgi:hypothetical protein
MRAVRQELLQVGALHLGMHTSTEKMISEPERWLPAGDRETADRQVEGAYKATTGDREGRWVPFR